MWGKLVIVCVLGMCRPQGYVFQFLSEKGVVADAWIGGGLLCCSATQWLSKMSPTNVYIFFLRSVMPIALSSGAGLWHRFGLSSHKKRDIIDLTENVCLGYVSADSFDSHWVAQQ